MPGGFQPHHSITNRKCAQEEHQEQKHEVKVVVARCFENGLVRYVAREHCPRADVHENAQLDRVDCGQSGREEHSQPCQRVQVVFRTLTKRVRVLESFVCLPYHPLVVDQVQYVLGYFKVAVPWEAFLQIPANACDTVAVSALTLKGLIELVCLAFHLTPITSALLTLQSVPE